MSERFSAYLREQRIQADTRTYRIHVCIASVLVSPPPFGATGAARCQYCKRRVEEGVIVVIAVSLCVYARPRPSQRARENESEPSHGRTDGERDGYSDCVRMRAAISRHVFCSAREMVIELDIARIVRCMWECTSSAR